jgi:uncharacterized phage protein (TIGR02218 family)
MRAASAGLIAMLNSKTQFLIADVLTLTQTNGTITRFTNADYDVVANGFTFTSSGPKFERSNTKLVIGIAVDTMDLTIVINASMTLGGLPWPQAVAAGALDGARIVVERAHMQTWGDTSAGTVIMFAGRVSEVSPSRNQILAKVKSDLELLDVMMPRNVYQPYCVHTLFDAGCTLLKASFSVAGIVTAGSGAASILASALTQATGYFDLGTLAFTSGVNSGFTRTVKTYTNVAGVKTLIPVLAFPAAPANGDTFSVTPGCDKTKTTCTAKFSNLAHFRGYPYMPTSAVVK